MIHIRRRAPDPYATWHAIETEEDEPALHTRPALCGWRAMHGWSREEGDEVTCPTCLNLIGGLSATEKARLIDGPAVGDKHA